MKKSLFLLLALLPSFIFAEPFVGFKIKEGPGVGYNQGYTSATLLYPFCANEVDAAFVDVRAHINNHGKWAVNSGFALRSLFTDEAYIGANVYYDFRQHSHSDLHQIGFGFEYLSCDFDFRANGYVPFSGSVRKDYVIPGGECVKSRYGLRGADFEVGSSVYSYCDYELYAAVGGYVFQERGHGHKFGGFQWRVAIDQAYSRNYGVEVSGTHDNMFNSRVQVGVYVNFPVPGAPTFPLLDCGCNPCGCCLDPYLTQRVVRREIIGLSHSHTACSQTIIPQ